MGYTVQVLTVANYIPFEHMQLASFCDVYANKEE
jgi:hypothetical protein